MKKTCEKFCFLNINISEVQIINSSLSDESLEGMSHGKKTQMSQFHVYGTQICH